MEMCIRDSSKYDRIDYRVLKADPDLRIGDDALVGRQRPFAEIKCQSFVLERDRIHEGRGDNIDNGDNDRKHEQTDQSVSCD